MEEDPQTWWKTHESTLPHLAHAAKKYLCVAGSSCASERVLAYIRAHLQPKKGQTHRGTQWHACICSKKSINGKENSTKHVPSPPLPPSIPTKWWIWLPSSPPAFRVICSLPWLKQPLLFSPPSSLASLIPPCHPEPSFQPSKLYHSLPFLKSLDWTHLSSVITGPSQTFL